MELPSDSLMMIFSFIWRPVELTGKRQSRLWFAQDLEQLSERFRIFRFAQS